MDRYFDSIIASFLFLDGVVFVGSAWWWRRSRTRANGIGWPKRVVLGVLAFSWFVIFYGSFIEPRFIFVQEREIALSTNPTEELRVVLIGDLHVGPYKQEAFVERVIRKIDALKPDAVLIAGDFVYSDISQIPLFEPLKNLKAPLGVFAVLGNHDYGAGGPEDILDVSGKRAKKMRETLESYGITVLVNQTHKFLKGNKTLELIGTDEYWTGRAVVPPRLEALAASAIRPLHPSVLLSHNADIVRDAETAGISLVLAAHTHGGQIRLPFWGPVPELPHMLGQKYDRGLFEFGKTKLFITSGLGEMGPRARLLVPPEMVVLTLKF